MSTASLYWSKKGDVACARHMPMPGGRQWVMESWRELEAPASRILYQCQHCGATPVAHRRRKQSAAPGEEALTDAS
jgi:hypothetical protein